MYVCGVCFDCMWVSVCVFVELMGVCVVCVSIGCVLVCVVCL